MATIHPDYERPLSDKLKALGANIFATGSARIDAVTLEPRGGKGKPRYADIVLSGSGGPALTHTVRVWRHGPISLLDCDRGTISGQDTMRLFGAENDCPMCMALVQHVRAHRGWHDAAWSMSGSSGQLNQMVHAFRPQLMTYDHRTGKWAQKVGERKQRDRDREVYLRTHPATGNYAKRVAATVKNAFSTMDRASLPDFSIVGTVSTGYSAAATCYKRGWGRGDKRLRLTVPPLWYKVFRECGGVMDGYIVGAILSQTEDTMVRWAVKPMSPVDRTTWWRASFAKVNGVWRFDRFLRNGAMGAGGGK